MNILFIGDISGKVGRRMLHRHLPGLVERHRIQVTVANVENTAGGYGISRRVLDELLSAGLDVLTSGNHIWDRPEAESIIDAEPRLLRPLNYPPPCPGKGLFIIRRPGEPPLAVVNIEGRAFMDQSIDCPFLTMDRALELLPRDIRMVLVDFHAEATSEKRAMGWYLDGRVSAVIGTHTHVQTADEQLLPRGTAYITDAGMTGPRDSVIGVRTEDAISRFHTGRPHRLNVAAGEGQFAAVVVELDPESGKAAAISRIRIDDRDGDNAGPQQD